MKFLIIPPDDYDVPNDAYTFYDTIADALAALKEMDGPIRNIEGYEIIAVTMEYRVEVDIHLNSFTAKRYEIVDSDGDSICGHSSTDISETIEHFKSAHGDDIYLSDINGYSVVSLSDHDRGSELTYELKPVGQRVYDTGGGTTNAKDTIVVASGVAAEEAKAILSDFDKAIAKIQADLKAGGTPNELVLGGDE